MSLGFAASVLWLSCRPSSCRVTSVACSHGVSTAVCHPGPGCPGSNEALHPGQTAMGERYCRPACPGCPSTALQRARLAPSYYCGNHPALQSLLSPVPVGIGFRGLSSLCTAGTVSGELSRSQDCRSVACELLYCLLTTRAESSTCVLRWAGQIRGRSWAWAQRKNTGVDESAAGAKSADQLCYH